MQFDPQTAVLLQAVITSVLLPLVISFLKNPKWSKEVKTYFALGFSVLVTGAMLFVEDKLNPEDIVLSILIVILGAQGFYHKWFQNSELDKYLTNVFAADKNELVDTVEEVLDTENDTLGTPKNTSDDLLKEVLDIPEVSDSTNSVKTDKLEES